MLNERGEVELRGGRIERVTGSVSSCRVRARVPRRM